MHSASSASPVRRLFLALTLLASASLALPALVYAQTRYTITKVGPSDSLSSSGAAINASGAVVGTDSISSGTGSGVSRPFIYANGTASILPSLRLGHDFANGINAAGTVVGTSTPALFSGNTRGFVVTNGAVTDLGPETSAAVIGEDGFIAGGSGRRGFLRSPAGVVTLFGPTGPTDSTRVHGISPTGGIVVGSTTTSAGQRAFRYANGVLTDLTLIPGESIAAALGINAAGVIVGHSGDRAVIFSGGAGAFIPLPAGSGSSQANGINSAGAVVGQRINVQTGTFVPFIYTPATGAVDLPSLVNNFTAAGFQFLLTAAAINDAGRIVGHGMISATALAAYRLDPVTGPAVPPSITTQPAAQTVAAGASATFTVVATGTGNTYQWRFNNNAIAGATAATYTIASVAAANAGAYTVIVTNAAGTVTSNPAELTLGTTPPPVAARLVNLSILTSLAGADDSFTMGYVVGGKDTSGTKPLVIRAAGPALTQLGVGGALTDPKLELFAGSSANGSNDNWGGGATLLAAMNAVGAFPFASATSLDAAASVNVAAGDNSVKVSPVGNLSGQVIAEIYDATPDASFTATTRRLVNVSVLKNIGTSLTAGFVIRGTGSRAVLIRAVGPTLGAAPFNVPGVVADPQLTLFNSASAPIGANDNWGGTAPLTAAFDSVGAFTLPATSRDAALLTTLAPGNYTVQVSGVGNTTGTALVEIYEAP